MSFELYMYRSRGLLYLLPTIMFAWDEDMSAANISWLCFGATIVSEFGESEED